MASPLLFPAEMSPATVTASTSGPTQAAQDFLLKNEGKASKDEFSFLREVSYIIGQKKQDTYKWNFSVNAFPYQGKKGKTLSINIKQFSDHHK